MPEQVPDGGALAPPPPSPPPSPPPQPTATKASAATTPRTPRNRRSFTTPPPSPFALSVPEVSGKRSGRAGGNRRGAPPCWLCWGLVVWLGDAAVRRGLYNWSQAAVVELGYTMDSKSIAFRGLWVRIPPAALRCVPHASGA